MHGRTDLIDLQRVHGFFEIRYGVALIQPTQIATFGGRKVVGIQTRQLGEIGTVVETFLERHQLALCLDLGNDFIDLDQDVTGACLFQAHRSGRAAFATAFFRYLDNVKPGWAAQDLADFTGLQLLRGFGVKTRQTIQRTHTH